MAEIVNLRQARKARAATADANRAAFGRTKSERVSDTSEQARRDALLDGAKREE